jgi:hypothetical protein
MFIVVRVFLPVTIFHHQFTFWIYNQRRRRRLLLLLLLLSDEEEDDQASQAY